MSLTFFVTPRTGAVAVLFLEVLETLEEMFPATLIALQILLPHDALRLGIENKSNFHQAPFFVVVKRVILALLFGLVLFAILCHPARQSLCYDERGGRPKRSERESL